MTNDCQLRTTPVHYRITRLFTAQPLIPALLMLFSNSAAISQTQAAPFTETLQGGGTGPEMILISGNRFMIGDHNGNGPDDEKPLRELELKSFALSRYEITFEQFDRFAQAVNKRPPNDASYGRGAMPVVNVTWEDAHGYAHWLSEQTGHPYRLPTEAQWEFAARAGSSSTFFWGNNPAQACFYANVADDSAIAENSTWLEVGCEDGYSGPAPVGQFPANPFGLHDIIGNVAEWVEDCYSDDYEALPADGSAIQNSYCRKRVARGGHWSSPAWQLRSSHRHAFPTGERRATLGFRVVRMLSDAERQQLAQRRAPPDRPAKPYSQLVQNTAASD